MQQVADTAPLGLESDGMSGEAQLRSIKGYAGDGRRKMSNSRGGWRREEGRRKKNQVAQWGESTWVNLSSDQNVTRAGMADELPFSASTHGKGGTREKRKKGMEDKKRSGKWGG